MRIYPLVMTNIANWKIPTINGGLVRWENHLFRLGPSIPWPRSIPVSSVPLYQVIFHRVKCPTIVNMDTYGTSTVYRSFLTHSTS